MSAKAPPIIGRNKAQKHENYFCLSSFHGNIPHLLSAKAPPLIGRSQTETLENSFCLSSFHGNMPHLLSAKLPHWLGEAKLKHLKTPSVWAVFTEICLTYWAQNSPTDWAKPNWNTWKLLLFEQFSRKCASFIERKTPPLIGRSKTQKHENYFCLSSFHGNIPHLLSAKAPPLIGRSQTETLENSFYLSSFHRNMPHLLSAKLPHWLGEAKLKNLKTPSVWAVFPEICLTYWARWYCLRDWPSRSSRLSARGFSAYHTMNT